MFSVSCRILSSIRADHILPCWTEDRSIFKRCVVFVRIEELRRMSFPYTALGSTIQVPAIGKAKQYRLPVVDGHFAERQCSQSDSAADLVLLLVARVS